jgi:glycosyltransferase involved in cell wall biosynthesis
MSSPVVASMKPCVHASALRFPPGIAVLIPAWQPEELLGALIRSLREYGCEAVVLVDDGSTLDRRAIFDSLSELSGVTLIRHAVNLGKGRALKSGLNFFLTNYPSYTGVVTADADGQHAVQDIIRVADELHRSASGVVLGARSLGGDVPLRSRFGNVLTRYIFRFLAGHKVSDTQTGLRGFSSSLVPELLDLPGEKYEYEMSVLAYLCRRRLPLLEIPIETVYIEGNRSSHFDPIRDSMRIYFVLLRFYASSIISAGIDLAGFSLAFALTKSIFTGMLAGRLSSIANYLLNRGFVFHSGLSIKASVWRYYLLAIALGTTSYFMILGLSEYFGWNVVVAKVVAETLLSLGSFALQKIFVFPVSEKKRREV